MEEIITGCPECLKKPLDHSDNIKTTLVCLVGTWRPVPKGGPGISPTPIFSAMCYLRRTYEKPLCSQNYLLIKVYLSSTRFCLFTSRAGVPPRCAYANHRHHSKLTTCPWMQCAARCQVEWRIYSRGWSVTHWLTSQGDFFFFLPIYSRDSAEGSSVDQSCECHVRLLLYLCVYTNVTQKDFIGVRDNIAFRIVPAFGLFGGP